LRIGEAERRSGEDGRAPEGSVPHVERPESVELAEPELEDPGIEPGIPTPAGEARAVRPERPEAVRDGKCEWNPLGQEGASADAVLPPGHLHLVSRPGPRHNL